MSTKKTIPNIPTTLPKETRDILEAMKELIEVRSGRRPNASFPKKLGTTATTADCINKINELIDLFTS